jgi:hypothetical protein
MNQPIIIFVISNGMTSQEVQYQVLSRSQALRCNVTKARCAASCGQCLEIQTSQTTGRSAPLLHSQAARGNEKKRFWWSNSKKVRGAYPAGLQSIRSKIAERNNKPSKQSTISVDNKDIAPLALIFSISISAQIE